MGVDGQLIVIEGIDGAGKTTVSKQICERYGYEYMTQPEDSWVGEVAREALKKDVEPACDLFLHMAAHANQQPKLISKLQSKNVVMDRYYHSRVAYQAVQSGFSPEKILDLHKGWTIEPSKVIILDICAEKALDRKAGSEDKFEKIDFLSEVRSVYRESFEEREDTHIVDAEGSKQDILNKIESIII